MASNIISQEKLLGEVDRIMQKKSIAVRVSDKQPMKGPLGIVLGVTRDRILNKLVIEREEVIPETEQIKTEFTEEALQDMWSLYGEDIYEVLAYYLVDDLAYKIDKKFIEMIKLRASTVGTLSFTYAEYKKDLFAVAQAIGLTINKSLSDLPISDNRSEESFAIVSSDVAALLSLTTSLGNPNSDTNEEDYSPSYMGTLAGTDYYIDYTHPNDNIDNIVFGIKGNGISKGSTIYSHYTQEWVETKNPETGENIYFLFDRTGMVINPLDKKYYKDGTGTSAFLGKLSVDITDLIDSIVNK